MEKSVQILRQMSIRRRLAYAFFILFIVPILAMIILSTSFEVVYFNNNLENHYDNFAYGSNIRINHLFEQLEMKFNYLIENNDILTDLYLYGTSPDYQSLAVKSRIENTITSIMSSQREIIYTSASFENGDTFSYSGSPINLAVVKEQMTGKRGWRFFRLGNKPLLLLTETIEIDYNSGKNVIFTCVIDMDEVESLLDDALGSVKQRIAIVDGADRIVVGDQFEGRNLGYELIVPLTNTGLNVKSTFIKTNNDLQGIYMTLMLFVLTFLLGSITLYLLNESIRLPLDKLLARIEQINGNNAIVVNEIESPLELIDEHEILNHEFNVMLIRLNQLLEESYVSKIHETELRTRIKELELMALQQRINPHFFYNLLDNVFWMAQMRGFEEIGEMISALGDFFKTSVSEKGAFVPIYTEIENVKSYVYLQQQMHKNQFVDQWQIDPEIIHYKTVKLILQPIIENCIVHGFEEIEEGGLIRISGRRESDKIIFEISDNGKGMDAETCERIRKKMNSTLLGIEDSIGMRNVNQRIKIYYGESYGVKIKSQLNVGTTVFISIPMMENVSEKAVTEA